MANKIIKIDSCIECPYCRKFEFFLYGACKINNNKFIANFTLQNYKEVLNIMPDWCPLEDGNSSGFWNKLIKLKHNN